MFRRGKGNAQHCNIFCCKATALRSSSTTPMWGGDGNAVGERLSPVTGSMDVVSTCVCKSCVMKRPD